MIVKNIGFVVVDYSEDWEQTLALDVGDHLPKEGILAWREERGKAFVFPTRKDARAAIVRTDHYQKAFGSDCPRKENCKVVPLEIEVSED